MVSAQRFHGQIAGVGSTSGVRVVVGSWQRTPLGTFGDAMVAEYGWSDTAHTTWQVARWPVGLSLLVVTVAVLFDHAPRRRQPALSWLALGSGIAVALSMLAAAGLALYVNLSSSFGSTYGPLAGIVALLLWSLMSSISIFYGLAVCAQLEALRAHGRAERVGRSVFHADTLDDVERRVRELIAVDGAVTLARLRDELGTSRKYAQALLEHLDQRRVTRRLEDDSRVLSSRRDGRAAP